MRRLVIDTNLFIDWLNKGRYGEVFFQRDAVKYLAAVVIMELYAGARSRRDRRILDNVTGTFAKAHRILVPTDSLYKEAGHILSELGGKQSGATRQLAALTNDVLIALSARSIGATVLTRNGADFLAIQQIRPFRLMVMA